MRKWLILVGVIFLSACSKAHMLPTQPDVNLQRYAGTWYEQARLPNRFQKQCAKDVQAHYIFQANSLLVKNQCVQANGEGVEAQGEGRLSDAVTPLNPAVLEVRFAPKWLSWLPLVWGDYWILKIEGDYQAALVGSPNRKYLWVLSRSPQEDPHVVTQLINYAQSLGFDTQQMITHNK